MSSPAKPGGWPSRGPSGGGKADLLGDVLEEFVRCGGERGSVERLEAVVRAWQYCVAAGWWRRWWGLRGTAGSRGADRIGTVGGFAGLDNGTVTRFGGLDNGTVEGLAGVDNGTDRGSRGVNNGTDEDLVSGKD
jgi:hypothetical protein